MKNNFQIDTSFWDNLRGKVFSRTGGWLIKKGVFCHGYEINNDLVGKISYFQMLILNATGRLPERRFADWLEAAFIGLSWPDPRIWCNQIGALGGSVRTSVVAATVAGVLSGDSRTFAQKTLLEGMEFIQRALTLKNEGISVEEIVGEECKRTGGKPIFVGYARPIANGDERVAPLEKLAKKLGVEEGEHLLLAYEIENILFEKYNEKININGYVSAVFSDHGYSPEEAYRICAVLVNSGVTACYIDTYERPPESFLPMRCDDIDYQGPPPRKVPGDKP